ncbi:MAG: alkaline phosphatase family protein [Gammaproteobacteria bacterium]
MKKLLLNIITILTFSTTVYADNPPIHPGHADHIIIFVWDGLRPDSVTLQDTPNLYRLMQSGTQFTDNHSSYPTFTMMNAASFATGDRAGKTGFFGNTLWHPGISGNDAAGNPVDFNQPVFTEDYKILQDLNKDKLFFATTLFNAAHEKNFVTAAIGKSGPAFMQDYMSAGLTLDEKHAHPLQFAKELQKAGLALPKYSANDYNPGDLTLTANNGAPTDPDIVNFFADGVTPDPSNKSGSPYSRANEYMMNIYLQSILQKKLPQLSVVWMRNPDTTEHNYGPGTSNYHDALQSNDELLGLLLSTLKDNNLDKHTDIIFVSDHAHSTVSGPLDEFPLRAVKNNRISAVNPDGYSVSGEIRTADLLTKAGFHAYDGVGCIYNPVLSGIKKDNSPLHATQTDASGKICGTSGTKYITKAYKVPANHLPDDAIIVAAGGGSDYIYLPSHNQKLAESLVRFLASHTVYGAIFADNTRYSNIKGTIPLETIGIQNSQGRSPDIIVSFQYDAKTKVNGLPGIEFSDSANTRGMHGSFSPIDVHNFLAAYGPDFKSEFKDALPTGNVDVAPTVAYLLGLNLPKNDGRILWESLVDSNNKIYQAKDITIKAENSLQHLSIYNASNQHMQTNQFRTELHAKILDENGNSYFYFDYANGVRERADSLLKN